MGIHLLTALVAVLTTANRGLVWSEVNTQRSSTEREMRWVIGEMGMVIRNLRAPKSSTETVPGPTLAVYPRRPSRVIASMWDSAWPVGIVETIFKLCGSMTVML